MIGKIRQCQKCKHLLKEYGRCKAFPNGIPGKIYSEMILHNEIMDGQEGNLVYEPKAKYIEQDKQLAINQKKLKELFEDPAQLAKIKKVLSKAIYRMVECRCQLDYEWSKSKIKITRFKPNPRFRNPPGTLKFSYGTMEVFHKEGIIEIKKGFEQLIYDIDEHLSQLFTLANDNDSILEITVFSDGKYIYTFSASSTFEEE